MTESIYESLEARHLEQLAAKGYQWMLFKDPIAAGTFGEIPSFHPHFIFLEVEPVKVLPVEMNAAWFFLSISDECTQSRIRDDVFWYVIKTELVNS